MTAADLTTPELIGLAVGIVAVGAVAGWWAGRRSGWAPAAGIVLIAATPLVPNVPVVGGFSLDDILPLLGVAFLAAAVDLRRLVAERPPLLLTVGVALLIVAGIVASLANAASPGQAVTMLLRGPGRFAFLAAIAILATLAEPAGRRRRLVARSMALLGTVEAVFGLAAFFLPLGGIGLEPTRKFSVLYFEVPGRIAGTLGISPNFLGAILILTIVLTTGLAIEARAGRDRLVLWSSVLVQFLALTLTFTRSSLGLAVVAVAVLLLVRGRIRYLVPVLIVVALGFATTPARSNEPGTTGGTDGTGGSGTPVAVERLTSDIPDRLALWTSATFMMVDHPLTGVGPGRMRAVAESDPDRYIDTPLGSAVNNAHNTILLAGAEEGLAGALGAFLVNLALALAAFRLLLRGRRGSLTALDAAGAIAVLGYLAQGMVNNLFTVAATGVVFALVAGTFVIELATAAADEPVPGAAPQRQRAPAGRPPEPIV